MEKNKNFHSVADVAKLLCVSTKTIRRLIGSRKISSVRIGRRVVIPAEALNDYISMHTRSALNAPAQAARLLFL
jgi:excisionase family DNA binding protein